MQRPDRQAIFLSEDDVVEEIDISSGGAGAGGAGGAEDGSDDGSELAEEVEGEEEEEEGDDAGAAEGADGGSGGGADGPDDACAVFREHSSSVYAVCAVPGAAGDIMLSASGDDTACLWRADTAALIARLSGHTDSVVAVEGSHDGKYLATGSLDGSVRVWNAKGELLHVVEGPSADIEWLSWHSKGHALLAGSADGTAWLWSVSDKSVDCMQVFVGHEGSVTCGAFSASGKTIVTGSADGTVRLWNPKAAQAVHTFEGPGWDGAPVNSLAIANDSPLVAACCQDGVVRLVNLQTLKTVLQYVHGDTPLRGVEPDAEEDAAASIECAAFCPSLPWIVSCATDGSIVVFDMASNSKRHQVDARMGLIKLGFIPTTTLFAVTTTEGTVLVYDARTGVLLQTFRGHSGMVFDFAFSGGMIVTAGDDGSCRAFKLVT